MSGHLTNIPDPLPTETPHIAHLLGAVVRAMETELQVRLRGAGFDDVRPAHFPILRFLAGGGLRLTDLAARAQMTKQSAGELVSYLEVREYVERVPDPSDGRVKIITLSAKGERSRAVASAAFREIEAGWAERVGEQRVAQLRATLSDIAKLDPRSSG